MWGLTRDVGKTLSVTKDECSAVVAARQEDTIEAKVPRDAHPGTLLPLHLSTPSVTFRRVAVSLRGPWTVTHSSLRVLRRVAAFCRPLRPVLLLVSFPRSRCPVVGVPGLCWMRRVPFGR